MAEGVYRRWILAAAAVLLCMPATAGPDAVRKLLKDRRIPFDAGRASEGQVLSILRAADPKAQLLSPEQAHKFVLGDTVELAETWERGICYLQVNALYLGGENDIIDQLAQWQKNKQCVGMIVDLRGSGGLAFQSVERIAEVFAEPDEILYTIRNGDGSLRLTQRARKGRVRLEGCPVILVTDRETHGACEALAAVLKGRRCVLLLGERTKGDDRLREILALDEERFAYMATGRIEITSGEDYAVSGVVPDVFVSEAEMKEIGHVPPDHTKHGELSEKGAATRELAIRVKDDAVLRRAADVLLGLKALGVAGPKLPETALSKSE